MDGVSVLKICWKDIMAFDFAGMEAAEFETNYVIQLFKLLDIALPLMIFQFASSSVSVQFLVHYIYLPLALFCNINLFFDQFSWDGDKVFLT